MPCDADPGDISHPPERYTMEHAGTFVEPVIQQINVPAGLAGAGRAQF
jgi:hypothetical protein